jgi:hypothetical protein
VEEESDFDAREPLVEEGGECKQVVMTERIKIEQTHDKKLSVTIE